MLSASISCTRERQNVWKKKKKSLFAVVRCQKALSGIPLKLSGTSAVTNDFMKVFGESDLIHLLLLQNHFTESF